MVNEILRFSEGGNDYVGCRGVLLRSETCQDLTDEEIIRLVQQVIDTDEYSLAQYLYYQQVRLSMMQKIATSFQTQIADIKKAQLHCREVEH